MLESNYIIKTNPIVVGLGNPDSTDHKYMNFIFQQYFIQNAYESNKEFVALNIYIAKWFLHSNA